MAALTVCWGLDTGGDTQYSKIPYIGTVFYGRGPGVSLVGKIVVSQAENMNDSLPNNTPPNSSLYWHGTIKVASPPC